MVLTFTQKIALQKKYGIVLLRALDADNFPVWAYLKTGLQGVEKLQELYHGKKSVHFADYGELIVSGYGEEPPEAVREMVKGMVTDG